MGFRSSKAYIWKYVRGWVIGINYFKIYIIGKNVLSLVYILTWLIFYFEFQPKLACSFHPNILRYLELVIFRAWNLTHFYRTYCKWNRPVACTPASSPSIWKHLNIFASLNFCLFIPYVHTTLTTVYPQDKVMSETSKRFVYIYIYIYIYIWNRAPKRAGMRGAVEAQNCSFSNYIGGYKANIGNNYFACLTYNNVAPLKASLCGYRVLFSLQSLKCHKNNHNIIYSKRVVLWFLLKKKMTKNTFLDKSNVLNFLSPQGTSKSPFLVQIKKTISPKNCIWTIWPPCQI